MAPSVTRSSLLLVAALLFSPAIARAEDGAPEGGAAAEEEKPATATEGAAATAAPAPAPALPAPAMIVVSKPEEPPSSWSSQKTVAVVLGGTSVAALGGGIAFGVSSGSSDDVSRDTAFATVGIVAGVVFLGAAVGLYLTAPKRVSRSTMSTPLRVVF